MVEGLGRKRDRHNVVLWIFLIGSVVSVLLLRSFSGEGISALDWVAVFVAAVAVGGYAVYAWWVSRSGELTIGRDQAGDNAYYIGLLLTFASLGVALVKLVVLIETDGRMSEHQMVVTGQVAQLIPDFGVALASTIFGIAARLWLQQQRVSPAEAAEDARRELERGVAQFTESLRVATGEISTSTNAIRVGVAKQLEDAAYGQVESFEEAQELVRDAATEMTRGLTVLSKMLAEVNAKVGGELAKLQDAQLGQALVELANRSRDASAGVVGLLDELGQASKQAGGLSDEVEALQKRLEALLSAKDTARLDDMIEHAVSKAERVGNAIAQSDFQISAAEPLLKRVADDARSIEAATGRASTAASEILTELDAARVTAQTLKGGLKGTKDDVRGVQEGLRRASTKVATAVNETENVASTLTVEVATAVEELRGLETKLQALQNDMATVQPDMIGFADRLATLFPEEGAEEFRKAVAKAQHRLEQLGDQTNGDAATEAIVRALEKRLRDIESKRVAATPETADPETISAPHDAPTGGLLGRFRLWKQ